MINLKNFVRGQVSGTDIAKVDWGFWLNKCMEQNPYQEIMVPNGRYHIRTPIQVGRHLNDVPVRIRGECPSNHGHGPRFIAEDATQPMLIVRSNSVLEDLTFMSRTGVKEESEVPCIKIHGRVNMSRITVYGWGGTGFYFEGRARDKTDTSGAKVRDCSAVLCGKYGFHTKGPDSNAIIFDGLDVRDCVDWGVLDESFLGCVWRNSMFHQHVGLKRAMSDMQDSQATRSQRTVFDLCYSEVGGVIKANWPSTAEVHIGGPTRGNGYFRKDGRLIRHSLVSPTLRVTNEDRAASLILEDGTTKRIKESVLLKILRKCGGVLW